MSNAETLPWQIWRRVRRQWRDQAVRHARERAVLTTWVVECGFAHML